jgi:hypothetical protein
LLPVLYEISLHEFVVEKKDWEVELAVFVDGDFNLLAFRNVRNLFAQSYFVPSELTIYGELLISFHGCESLNFGDDSVFFGQAFDMYGCHILQLGAIWTLLKTLSGKLETVFVLFNEVPRSREHHPQLLISWLDLKGLKAVLLAPTKLSQKQVQLRSTHIKSKKRLMLLPACGKSLVKEMHRSLALQLITFGSFGVLHDDIVQSLHCMLLEIRAHFFRRSVVRERLKRFKFWPSQHLRCELFAVKWMIGKVLQIIIHKSFRPLLGHKRFLHLLEVLVFIFLH